MLMARSAPGGESGEIGHRGWKVRRSGAFFLPQPCHARPMRALTIALCLIATPALADVAGTASAIDAPESCRSSPLLRLLRLCYAPQA